MSDKQDDGRLVTVGRFYDPTEAHFYRTVLESRGIQAAVMGESSFAMFPPVTLFGSASGGSVQLKVRAEDAEAATAILEEEGKEEALGRGADPGRIGVFGGTFDPIHNTHIEIARTAITESALDLVFFVVAARPPHKQDETYASADERLAMAQAALADEASMEASGLELEREGPSFTADTLIALGADYPDAELFLIVGLDSLADLPTWKDPEMILERAHVLVVPRRGEGEEPASLEGCCTVLPFAESELSSTEVRNRIVMGKSIADFVPEAVAQLIEERGVYGHPFEIARADEYLALLGARLPNKTLSHSISVAEFIRSFSDLAGITDEQATTAGLLHDLCKAMQADELLAGARDYGLELTPLQREKPTLLHGALAAEECRGYLGIDDEAVIEAIRWHTTGRPDWGRVGLALYVADFAEPLRTFPEAAEARAVLEEEGFDAVVRFVAERKLAYMCERFTVDPMSEAFAEWLGLQETL